VTEGTNSVKFLPLMFFGSKYCPTSIDITGLWVLTRKLRDCPLFHVSLFFKNCHTSGCATAGNSVRRDIDVFRRQIITLRFYTIPYYYYYYSVRCPNELFKYSFVFVRSVYYALLFVFKCCAVSVWPLGHELSTLLESNWIITWELLSTYVLVCQLACRRKDRCFPQRSYSCPSNSPGL
jgi:hypothetical protein